MIRRAKSPIPAHLYRHFAIVTLALSFALAMFADGEQRQSIVQEVEAREQQAELARQSAKKFGKPRLIKAPPTTVGSFGEDVAMGSASSPLRGGSEGSLRPGLPPGTAANVAAAQAFGYPAQQVAAMSLAERDQLVKGLRSAGVLNQEERRRRAAALLAQSATRSGVEQRDDVPQAE